MRLEQQAHFDAEILLLDESTLAQPKTIVLPDAHANIFARLIHHPFPHGKHPRELACCEMICSLFINAPTVAKHMITWLGKKTGHKLDLKTLKYEFQAERSVSHDDFQDRASKRIDIEITGNEPTSGETVLLWMLEVKVRAPISHSRGFSDEAGDDVPVEDVSQIKNYDELLEKRSYPYKAGFVLGVFDLECKLPKPSELKSKWHCFTWTQFGTELERCIENESTELTATERLLARHVAGFIRLYLWRNESMENEKLTFNDIALMRAYGQFGRQCKQKIKRLADSFEALLQDSKIGTGELSCRDTLFGNQEAQNGYGFSQFLFKGADKTRPLISVGIFAHRWYSYPTVELGIEFSGKLVAKSTERVGLDRTIRDFAKKYDWTYEGPEPEDSADDNCYLYCEMNLTALLDSDDPKNEVDKFITENLTRLKQSRILELLR